MLVDYSDSESEDEAASVAPPKPQPTSAITTKPAFQAASGKIKVDLPTIRPDPSATTDEPPAKKARTAGAFSGINSFLPAPKRTSAQNAPKKGVSLKTSSEAAFSREVPQYHESMPGEGLIVEEKDKKGKEEDEVKLVGKATRFLPLSVSSKKKKKPVLPKAPPVVEMDTAGRENGNQQAQALSESKPKVRKSLFSVQQEEEREPAIIAETYEPLTTQSSHTQETVAEPSNLPPATHQAPTLSTAASDLNLTAAQKRHLFGRNGKDVSITHFDMDSEYANNEKMRQAGEVTQHRAVKAVAPGKHSLQQLVNNAKTQRDGLEDAWAEGRKNRGEGSARYGWGK